MALLAAVVFLLGLLGPNKRDRDRDRDRDREREREAQIEATLARFGLAQAEFSSQFGKTATRFAQTRSNQIRLTLTSCALLCHIVIGVAVLDSVAVAVALVVVAVAVAVVMLRN